MNVLLCFSRDAMSSGACECELEDAVVVAMLSGGCR